MADNWKKVRRDEVSIRPFLEEAVKVKGLMCDGTVKVIS